jgi:membrane-bound lytic murein transglycosylase F
MVWRTCILSLLLISTLSGCTPPDALDEVLERGSLVVVSRNSPTTYYQDKDGANGFEHALASLLAKDLGVELEIKTVFSLTDIFLQLDRDESDIAAAGLTLTPGREANYPRSASYYRLRPQIVYVAGTTRPRTVEELQGREILVLADSSHIESLETLKKEGLEQLRWREIATADSMELLERVDSGKAPLAVIDSVEFSVQQSLYPRLKVALDLEVEQDMVWYLSPGADNERLLHRINKFLQQSQENGILERLRQEHFGHSYGFSRISSHTFTRNMERKLPPYRNMIRQVAREYQMDWHLLAAVAYQESHWDPVATSPTGVRGMMMLTMPTAQDLGVENRLDPLQSLRGGARYLKDIRRRLPADIHEPDRTWLALAAYNIGMGHLEDARILTEHLGGDPHLWQDVMEHLPLLQKPQYYQSLRYGFARGVEAVTYVQNIRHYHSILEWQEIPDINLPPPADASSHLPHSMRGVRLLAL